MKKILSSFPNVKDSLGLDTKGLVFERSQFLVMNLAIAVLSTRLY
ncbi:hypothetical protein [Tumidithrix helvetica]